MPRRSATEKRAGGSRGWRPQADEEAVAPQSLEDPDDEGQGDPAQQDYGIKIIWGNGERRPGARLEKIAARQR
jgi:hypothetical protein